ENPHLAEPFEDGARGVQARSSILRSHGEPPRRTQRRSRASHDGIRPRFAVVCACAAEGPPPVPSSPSRRATAQCRESTRAWAPPRDISGAGTMPLWAALALKLLPQDSPSSTFAVCNFARSTRQRL